MWRGWSITSARPRYARSRLSPRNCGGGQLCSQGWNPRSHSELSARQPQNCASRWCDPECFRGLLYDAKTDNHARPATNRQRDWATTDGAVLDQCLFWLRCIDLDRENFAAMRTGDFCLRDKFHLRFVILPDLSK